MSAVGMVLVVAFAGLRPAHPDVVERFHGERLDEQGYSRAYRLYLPTRDCREASPLVIWFHGRGEAGHDNRDQLAWLELVFGIEPRQVDVRAIVLAVQCGEDESWLQLGTSHHDRPFAVLDAVVARVISRHDVDRSRIYLAGISHGASACWQYAVRHPRRFAAMLPMATSEISADLPGRLSQLPIWAFQSTADGEAQLGPMRNVIKRLSRQGGCAQLTVVSTVSHNCWTAALGNYRGWRWMMDQRRGRAERAYRRSVVGRYLDRWQLGGALIVAGLVLLLVWQYVRRLAKPTRGDPSHRSSTTKLGSTRGPS